MKNKEQKIVRLLEEGFSYETIKKMSDLHINKIYESIEEESSTEVKQTTYTKQDIDAMKNKGGGLKVDGGTVVPNDDGSVTVTQEMGEEIDDTNALGKLAMQTATGQEMPHDADDMAPDGMDDDSDNDRKMMANEEFYGEIDEESVIEELFGNSKKKMKTPITTLGMFEETNEGTRCWKGYEKKGMKTMFGKRVPNCVKKESKEEKVRQIEESILSLIKKSQGKMLTKKDILSEQPSIAPARPTVKPGVRPERGTPYKPKHSPKPKAGTEVKPARPTVKPGVRPERGTPYKPKHSPKPKAGEEQGLPEFLKFNNLNIKFRDE
jgi:hypothetical protein